MSQETDDKKKPLPADAEHHQAERRQPAHPTTHPASHSKAPPHPELTGWKTHVEITPPPSPGTRAFLQAADDSIRHAADHDPHATDRAVNALRIVGIGAGFVPGPGTLIAIGVNGVAATIGMADARSRGDSPEHMKELAACSGTSLALSALPLGGAIGQAVSGVTGASLTGRELNHDLHAPHESHGALCRNYILEAGEHVMGIDGKADPAPPPTPKTEHHNQFAYGKSYLAKRQY